MNDDFAPIVLRRNVLVNPADIRYSQQRISGSFDNGGSLQGALQQLQAGTRKVSDFPNIRVVNRDGAWYTLDNRRLLVFKHFKELIRVDIVQDDILLNSRFNTTSKGLQVQVMPYIPISQEDIERYLNLKQNILFWTLEEVKNTNLFKGKLAFIPQQFKSVDHYYQSFVMHVAEELRAKMASGMDKIGDEPAYAKIRIMKSSHSKISPELQEVEAEVLTFSPEDLDLRRANYVLQISARLQLEEHTSLQAGITLHTEPDPNQELITFKFVCKRALNVTLAPNTEVYVQVSENITTDSRIARLLLRSNKKLVFLQQLIRPAEHPYQEDPIFTPIPPQLRNYIHTNFNASQQQAIFTITAPINTNSKLGKGITLLRGPPGTGKTATILGSLSVLVMHKEKILVCSASNCAVGDIARKVVNRGLIGANGETIFPFVVLAGGMESYDLSGGLEDIFLFHITSQLQCIAEKLQGVAEEILTFFSPKFYQLYLHQENQVHLGIINFMQDFIDKWERVIALQVSESQQIRVAKVLAQSFKAADTLSRALACILQLFPSLDSRAASKVLKFLQNGFPLSPNLESSFVKKFIEQWLFVHKQALSLKEILGVDINFMVRRILNQAAVVFCTVSTCGSFNMREMQFSIGIIDEACQCIESESLLALELITHRCVLIGDPQQLPSTVLSLEARRLNYGRSLMARMFDCNHPARLLNTQYRMHPDISRFPNKQFYNGIIKDGDIVKTPQHSRDWFKLYPAYAFYDIQGAEQRDPLSLSIYNESEVNAVLFIISTLLKNFPEIQPSHIGIITPYREQLKRIEKHLAESYRNQKFNMGTVDGFQGKESPIVIFCGVRANGNGALGFVSNTQRINVAITRACYSLWILGNSVTLQNSPTWSALIEDAKKRLCWYPQEVHKITITATLDLAQAVKAVTSSVAVPSRQKGLFGSAKWQVQLSDKSFRTLKAICKDGGDIKPIFKKLLSIAQGNWPHTNHAAIDESGLVKEYKFNNGMVLLWGVDIKIYPQKGMQVLRVWDVLPNASDLVSTVEKLVKNIRQNCNYIELRVDFHYEGNLAVPHTYTDIKNKATQDVTTHENLAVPGRSSIEDSLLLSKFFPMSDHFARMLAIGKSAQVPFDLSWQEEELVNMPMESAFILGRSGTGKTTVLVYRMFGIQQHYDNSTYTDAFNQVAEHESHKAIKQLFVTASSRLCDSIADYYTQLANTPKMHPNSIDKDEKDVMLDEYEERSRSLATVAEKYSSVQDTDCPLIITFVDLLSMLDNSLQKPFFGAHTERQTNNNRKPTPLKALNSRQEVTSGRFSAVYYAHMDQQLTSEMEVAVVYLQIMSFIKGSAEAMATKCGYLSEQDYMLFPFKKNPLPEDKRRIVYKIFQKYEKMKLDRHDFDQCDYVFHIIAGLKAQQIEPKMDFIYIDEVQDLTQAQLLLFKYLSTNLEGFVFAGDTAQTITSGVGFRFEDLRSLFYINFLNASEHPPNIHYLTKNFRTHSGVCDLASSVTDPILHFFPTSIDKLQKEEAQVKGDPPVFIKMAKELFVQMLEFGADQAIIVRTQEAKEELKKRILKVLILTVHESKGLEFKSVLLFNFWRDSPSKKVWRAIHNYMANTGIGTPPAYTQFLEDKHIALCSELKQLYVGITRAKQDLLFFDEDPQTYQPMLDYWTALECIKVDDSADYIKAVAHKSDPATWMHKGIEYFQSRKYELALRCFQNSGPPAACYMAWTKASMARSEAEELQQMDKFSAAKRKLIETAEHFLDAQKHNPDDRKFAQFAVTTYIRAEEWVRAGNVYMNERQFQQAAETYLIPRNYLLAANAFEKANMLPDALRACMSGLLFAEGKDIILKNHGDEHVPDIYKFWRTGALHFHNTKEYEKMLDFVDHLVPITERRRFFTRYGYINELVRVDLAEGNFIKAAETYLLNGKYKEAASAYLKAKEPVKAAECLIKFVVSQEAQRSTAVPSNLMPLDTTMPALIEAQKLLEAHADSHVAFDVNKIIATKQFQQTGSTDGLEHVLLTARQFHRVAAELDILFTIISVHINNPSYPIQKLIQEGGRLRELCLLLAQGLSAKPEKPCPSDILAHINEYFQVSTEGSAGTKIVLRVDWLSPQYYQQSISKPHQFELREEVFIEQAVEYLGKRLIQQLLAIFDRKIQLTTTTPLPFRLDEVLLAVELLKDLLDIFQMTHLRFNETLKDLKAAIYTRTVAALQTLGALYYPVARRSQNPIYFDNRHKLIASNRATKVVEALTVRVLLSPYREIDGLCLTLLAETGRPLVELGISNYKYQFRLVNFLRWKSIIYGSGVAVEYLDHILLYKSMRDVGLPLSQVVWILEKLTVYSLAGNTVFNCFILPKTLVLDCICGRERAFWSCLSKKLDLTEGRWYLDEIWDILGRLLTGAFYDWIEQFPYENSMRNFLVERLLQLAYLIYINNIEFAEDMFGFMRSFMNWYPTFNLALSDKWLHVLSVTTQQSDAKSYAWLCGQFVTMMQSSGEPFCLMKRYNTKKDRKWAITANVPIFIVVEENKNMSFAEIVSSTGRQPAAPTTNLAGVNENPVVLQVDLTHEDDTKESTEEVEELSDINPKIHTLVSKIALAWLKRARNTLYNMSSLDKYKRKAHTILSRIRDSSDYMNFYIKNICALREDLVVSYEQLNAKLATLKSLQSPSIEISSAIDEGLDAAEDVVVLQQLDINMKRHSKLNLKWLYKIHEEGQKKVASIHTLLTAMEELCNNFNE